MSPTWLFGRGADLVAGETDLTLQLRYQACNDMICTSPMRLTLAGRVTIGDGTTSPTAINQSVFAETEREETPPQSTTPQN